MACMLGCASEYKIMVADRGGAPLLTSDPLPVASGKWGRKLDGVSTADITLDLSEPGCCGIVDRIRTWRNELIVYRDGQRVWEGPLTSIDIGSDDAKLGAHDVAVYLARRRTRNRILATADLSRIAALIVADAFSLDDPRVLPYLKIIDCGVEGTRDLAANSGYAADLLKELIDTAIDYTAIGRSLVFGGPLAFGRLATLRCDHFEGDMRVLEDGLAAGTDGYVQGGDGVSGQAGGVDDFYGLIDQYVKVDAIKDAASARWAAQNLIAGANPPPLFVEPPAGALTSDAPVCIDQLVPGAIVPIHADCLCRPAEQDMRLVSLDVSWDGEAEKVQPKFETPAIALADTTI